MAFFPILKYYFYKNIFTFSQLVKQWASFNFSNLLIVLPNKQFGTHGFNVLKSSFPYKRKLKDKLFY
jgi:hypothetical protein